MTKLLYITSKSIYTCAAQSTLLEIIEMQLNERHEVGVLLIQDSTLACWKHGKNIITDAAASSKITIYALKEDLEARGLLSDKIHPKIQQINYDEAIEIIMEQYEKVITWC